ncbi:VWA domain-containing protein [Mahella australiensis]|uniref:von Willebrand factor type A n=1 Tax=Mahella australiensis (strain DSM 15567 / CIP 107919 / 50-1 BON) TaxID=697281 RepID=F3ZXH0_MAHA5|nr:VWA domain-containing protein [Mahella australiensis]AEE97651.1 von Willebrand factor type A [Mahella australiensis 50-1 BON]
MPMPEDLQAARLRLVKERPYLASAALALHPVEKPGLETMAVDQYWRLYYDPVVVERWTAEEMSGVLYHEICHLIRDHASRMKNLDHTIANIATDAEINDDLIHEGVKLPENPVTPASIRQPDNLLAEEYYAALEAKAEHISLLRAGVCDNPADENKTGMQTPAPCAGRCGSCATGQQESWEDDPPDSSNGINQAEAELIRRDTAVQIIHASKSCGNIPAHLVRWANAKLQPKVDWRREMASVVRNAVAQVSGTVDYSYNRPNRRQGQFRDNKIILPSLCQPIPEVAIVVDTSGSISNDMLTKALAEVSGVLKSCGSRGVTVLATDASVHTCKKVFNVKQVNLVGGGGTNMGSGIEAALKLKPRPQVVIVLTDGYTPWPGIPPQKAKVIVGMMSDQEAPAWAKTIKIA